MPTNIRIVTFRFLFFISLIDMCAALGCSSSSQQQRAASSSSKTVRGWPEAVGLTGALI